MNSAASEPEGTGAGAPHTPPGKGRALVVVPVVPPSPGILAGLGRSHGYVAAGVAVVMGLGIVAGTQVFAGRSRPVAMAQAAPPPDPAAEGLMRVEGEVRSLRAGLEALRATAEDGRQAEAIRALRRGVEALKGDLDGVKTASTAAVGQLGAKIDRLDRDPSAKLAEVTARIDRIDPSARLADVTARLDRIERQVASADTTGSIPTPAAVAGQARAPVPPPRSVQSAPAAPVAAAPPPRPEAAARSETAKAEPLPRPDAAVRPDGQPRVQEAAARPATVEGWMLRDVYGGMALVEGRAGLREVAPGEYLPGVGEIRSIERRGRGWVVVTSRGVIQADNRW